MLSGIRGWLSGECGKSQDRESTREGRAVTGELAASSRLEVECCSRVDAVEGQVEYLHCSL